MPSRPRRFFPAVFLFQSVVWTVIGSCALLIPMETDREPAVSSPAVSSSSDPTGEEGREAASVDLTVRAQGMLESGRVEEAVSVLEKAIALHPANPYAYYYLAKARFSSDQYDRALPPLGKAELYFRGDPSWLSWVHTLRGKTFEALLRWEEAEEEYRRAVGENPNNRPAREALDRLTVFSD